MKVKCYWESNEQYYSATTAIRMNTKKWAVGQTRIYFSLNHLLWMIHILHLPLPFVFLVNTAGFTSKPSVDEFPSSGNGDACILHSFSKAQ